MNSLYLILIAICFSAGVLTAVLKSDNPQSTHIFTKNKIESFNQDQVIIDSRAEDAKQLNIFIE